MNDGAAAASRRAVSASIGPYAFEQARGLGSAHEREHRHRHVHGRANAGHGRREPGALWQRAVEQQVARRVGSQAICTELVDARSICDATAVASRGERNPVEPVFDEQRISRWQERVEPRHAVTSRLELDATLRAGGPMAFGDGCHAEVFTERAGLASQGRGRDRDSGHREVLVEPGAQNGVVIEVGWSPRR